MDPMSIDFRILLALKTLQNTIKYQLIMRVNLFVMDKLFKFTV